MYTESLIWFLSWPALIAASYYLATWLVRKYEENSSESE
jgi:hypothetical protein